MIYNLIRTKGNGSEQIASFGGLNRTDNAEKNEFSDMINLSSDKYPFLTPSKAAKNALEDSISGIRAVIAPQYSSSADITSFTGVAGDKFYYNGEEIDFEDAGMTIPDGDVTLVDFNGRIIICVYDGNKSHMLYYDYTATGADEQGRRYVRSMEQGVKNITCTAYSGGDPGKDIYITNYLTATDAKGNIIDWKEYFSVGDSVFITGFHEDDDETFSNNTVSIDSKYQNSSGERIQSCIVEKIVNATGANNKVTSSKLYVQLYNYKRDVLVFKKISKNEMKSTVESKETANNANVYIKIPTMNHVCIHNNRLWGTNPNGEYIYASKQGDCFNFNTFQGLANDSFYAEIGTAGGFVGIVSFRDNLVAFKRDYIHHVYGDKPSNFTIPKQLEGCGCIDIRSAAQVGTTMYFLGYGGIYAYVGGQPTLISKKLDRKYKSAVAMTDGQKYIVSCKGDKGNETLVLDTEHGLWHMEDYIDAVGSFRWHDKLYIATADKVYEYGANLPQKWNCESVIIHDDTFDNKGMTELWIRARIDEGSEIKVLTSEDGGVFLDRGTLKGMGTLKVYRIPIRFINGEFYQYRLEGTGNAVIYSIERVLSSGGRQYRSI